MQLIKQEISVEARKKSGQFNRLSVSKAEDKKAGLTSHGPE